MTTSSVGKKTMTYSLDALATIDSAHSQAMTHSTADRETIHSPLAMETINSVDTNTTIYSEGAKATIDSADTPAMTHFAAGRAMTPSRAA